MRNLSVGLAALLLLAPIANSEEIHGCTTADARAVRMDDGVWVLMRQDGAVLSKESYCNGGEYSDGLIRLDLCHGSRHDYLTTTGEKVVTVEAVDAADFSQGLAAVQDEEDNWGYVDKAGHMAIAPRFAEAGKFNEGVAPVKITDAWQYIDGEGRLVLKPHRDGRTVFAAFSFSSGAALILLFDPATDTYEKGLIDRAGTWLITPTDRLTGELNNGLAPLWDESANKMGFINSRGEVVIPPQFTGNAALPFQEGLAAVFLGTGARTKVGFIDKEGRWAISAAYENAYHFCGGLAPVKLDGLWGFVDYKGQFVIPPKFADAESFEDGIAEVYVADHQGKLHRELINRQGSVLFREAAETNFVTLD